MAASWKEAKIKLHVVVELSDLSEGKSINSWGIATLAAVFFQYHKIIIPSDHNLNLLDYDNIYNFCD